MFRRIVKREVEGVSKLAVCVLDVFTVRFLCEALRVEIRVVVAINVFVAFDDFDVLSVEVLRVFVELNVYGFCKRKLVRQPCRDSLTMQPLAASDC